jgi:transposase-like protein
MANGHMGKKVDDSVRQRALQLIAKGNTVTQVASRLGVSQSVVRNWVRDAGKSSGKA